MLLTRIRIFCRPLNLRLCSSGTGFDSIQFEDLPPSLAQESSLEDKDNIISQHAQRYYVPPPVSDDQLLNQRLDISEWPKSRVIWALGRIGYLWRRTNTSDCVNIDSLHDRLSALVPDCNTRDLVRGLQAIAYGPIVQPLVSDIRKTFATNISQVNDLFLVSFVYANLKLVGRYEWTTGVDGRYLQFLFSELIHRKNKIYCNHWLDICSAILGNDKVREMDSIQPILMHACQFAIKHVKDVKVIEKFSSALLSVMNGGLMDVQGINNVMLKKFSRQWNSGYDALSCGFYFFLNDQLLTPNVIDRWLTAIRTASKPIQLPKDTTLSQDDVNTCIKIGIIQDKIDDIFVSSENVKWLSELQVLDLDDNVCPSIGFKSITGNGSLHASKVIRRMFQTVFQPSTDQYLESKFVGPYWCPILVSTADRTACIEWDDSWNLAPPYQRAFVKCITDLRRKYMAKMGIELIILSREIFIANSTEEKRIANEKFASIITSKLPQLVPVGVEREPGIDGSRILPTSDNKGVSDLAPRRMRRESKRIENSLKAKRRTITKEYRKKIRHKR